MDNQQSTSKMLAYLKSSDTSTDLNEVSTDLDEKDFAPQLAPTLQAKPDMQNALTNILGLQNNQKHTPMDK